MKDLSLHILDIAQNAIKAKANRIAISLTEENRQLLTITIADNGSGMNQDILDKVTDPYTTSRTTRKIGLGIPLFKQNAERSGGKLHITSTLGQGTNLMATFYLQHIDCLPLGDMAGVVALLVNVNPDIDFVYQHVIDDQSYTFDTVEVKKILGDTPINTPDIHQFIKSMIKENIQELYINTN